MPMWRVVVLGAVAGFTIYLGLPVARWRQKNPGPQSLLTALALGVLLFLVWDILSKALQPVEDAMKQGMKSGQWNAFVVLAAMLVIGVVVGLVGLVMFDAAAVRRASGVRTPTQLAMMIATGLGLHNFSEGLAISSVSAFTTSRKDSRSPPH
jgi:ZIP family zinc transporter